MIHISIIVPKGAVLGAIEGPRQVFTEVNQVLERMGREPMFNVQLTALSRETAVYDGMYMINADALVGESPKTDLIVIPALQGDMAKNLRDNQGFIPWIVQQYKAGAEVASLCVGAFLLASTGLVNGRKCATHWMAANEFRNMFPQVQLVEDKILTDEFGI